MSSKNIRKLHGSPTYRSTIKVLVAGTSVDNSNSTGTQYTFSGGESIELHNRGPSAAYVEVCASASQVAAGAHSFTLEVGEKYPMTLPAGVTKVSCDGVSGACGVDIHEREID